MRIIDGAAIDRAMSWPGIVAAIRAGHTKPKPQSGDFYFGDGTNGLLSRTAWIDGLGCCVKAATVFPGNLDRNPPLASIQGSVLLFDPGTGVTRALLDGPSLTRWKTAGDSALGSAILSRPDVRVLAMVGAGNMAEPLIRAHLSVRPNIERIVIWNRSAPRAVTLASQLADLNRRTDTTTDLEAAVRQADIVCSATMTKEPVIRGAWLKPGSHLDLVGAYTAAMREADDEAIKRSRLYVDFRGSTIGHIGELMIPLQNRIVTVNDVLGDLYDLVPDGSGRTSADDITLFKNGGGAHLDLMTALAAFEATKGSETA